jgi:rare lipoprotein A
MRYLLCTALGTCLIFSIAGAQVAKGGAEIPPKESRETEQKVRPKVLYGIASYYADKFNGRPTANGEIYDQKKLTAACNVLPLGTLIRVTNVANNKSVIVRTNDRLHIRMKRIVDLSRSAAEILGYTGRGLAQVKVEVLERK